MLMTRDEFKARVDAALRLLPATPSAVVPVEWQRLHEGLSECFGDSAVRPQTQRLERLLVAHHAMDGDAIRPYYEIAHTISDACRDGNGDPPTSEQWDRAIDLAVRNPASLLKEDDVTIAHLHARSKALGESCRQLRIAGYDVDLNEDGRVLMDAEPRAKLARGIDAIVASIGGMNVVDRVISAIRTRYDSTFERYIITREAKQVGQEVAEPSVPWGYLLQLGINHLTTPGTPTERAFEQLFRLARLAVSILDVQTYSTIPWLFLDRTTVVKFLQESAVYDALFTLPQLPRRDCDLFLSAMESDGLFAGRGVDDLPLSTLPALAKAILARASEISSTLISAADLGRHLHKSQQNVKRALDQVFAHSSRPNPDLTFPPLSTDVDYYARPLVWIRDGVYWCPPRSIAGKAIFEAAFQAVRAVDKKVDDRFGILMEEILRREFAVRGIEVKTGHYAVDSKDQDGECDLIIESSTTVVFIELKKKPLKRTSQSGSDVSLLIDIAQSLAKSQAQAIGHEYFLKRDGKLHLKVDGAPDQQVVWGDRRVLRVSVVLADYGSLSDRATVQQLLLIGTTMRMDADDAEVLPQLQKAQKEFNELRAVAERVDEFKKKEPFFDSLMLSMPQLLLMLRNSKDSEGFVKELTRGQRSHVSTKDPYDHYRFARKLP